MTKNSNKTSPVPIKEARIVNNTASPKMSPINKSFIPPNTPIVSDISTTVTKQSKSIDYDERKNPFADAEDEDDDKNNPTNDGTSSNDDDDYNKNLNPFAS